MRLYHIAFYVEPPKSSKELEKDILIFFFFRKLAVAAPNVLTSSGKRRTRGISELIALIALHARVLPGNSVRCVLFA